MIAKFEKRISAGAGQTCVYKYKNLHNLPHWHMEHEIIFVAHGSIELNVNNKLYMLTAEMGAFVKSEEVHYMRGSLDSITYVIKTSAEAIRHIIQGKRLTCPVLKHHYPIKTIFSDIEKELKPQKEYSGIIADSIITRLVAEIFRTEPTCNEKAVCHPNDKDKRLLNWIISNYTHISFEDAAIYMHFSKSYFSKYFKTLTGMKYSKYLNILKVSKAIESIAEGEKNITEVSIDCGFGTIRNFNRIFKSLTGYTPKSLPKNYVFLYNIVDGDPVGLDPTLNCSEMME